MNEKSVILFDGVCNLCNATIQEIIRRDTQEKFQFASFQSHYGQNFLKERNLNSTDFNTFILYEPHIAYYTKSQAFIRVLRILGGSYSFLGRMMGILPTFLRDGVYSIISNNRYRWYGKMENCMIPTPELQKRFLS